MELFRKIPCAERLPEISDLYDTDWGNLAFHVGSGNWKDGFDVFDKVDWWLEEIQLPTDEEIEKMASDKIDEVFSEERPTWEAGFKSALELLTGKK